MAGLTALHGLSLASLTMFPLFLLSSGILLSDPKLDKWSNALLSVFVVHLTFNLLALIAVALG